MLKRLLLACGLATVMILPGSVTAAPALAAAPKVYRIMPVGDSITRGGGQLAGQYIGYRAGLQAHLRAGARGFRYDFVGSMRDRGAPDGNHEGHGGWTIDGLASRMDAWMVAYRPDIVLLHAGTNNITVGDSPAVTAKKLRGLIAQIRRRGPATKIFVAKVITSRDPGRRPATLAYQRLIPRVVAQSGRGVHLVDQSTVGGSDIYDWTHPNNYGYSKMAYNWYRSLDAVIAGGRWKPVANPYRAAYATTCQIHYGLGGVRICRIRRA